MDLWFYLVICLELNYHLGSCLETVPKVQPVLDSSGSSYFKLKTTLFSDYPITRACVNMVGMYRIENTSSEHISVLKYTVMVWGERQFDIYLVSKEGVKVYTQR